MNIAVNTRLLLDINRLEGIGWFTYETLKRITTGHPEHDFYFIFDRPYSEDFIFSDNIRPIVVGPQARHPFLYYLWFEKSIPNILKKIRAEFFLSTDGFLSLNAKVPSCLVIHDINFVHHPKNLPWLENKFYNRNFPKYAHKATRIGTVSNYSKEDIQNEFDISPNNIDVIYNGSNPTYKPINQEDKRNTKAKFTNGEDYFIFVGALNPRKNIDRLLLGFDRFKKESKSKNKLVIVGEKMFKTKNIQQVYQKIAAKDDIVFTGRMNPDELKLLYGSALALAFVPLFEGFGIPIIEAMNCEIPVIASNVTSLPEVAGDAAIYCDPYSIESIAGALTKIYSDEVLRKELIEQGNIQKQKFCWDKSAENLWACIEKCF